MEEGTSPSPEGVGEGEEEEDRGGSSHSITVEDSESLRRNDFLFPKQPY